MFKSRRPYWAVVIVRESGEQAVFTAGLTRSVAADVGHDVEHHFRDVVSAFIEYQEPDREPRG